MPTLLERSTRPDSKLFSRCAVPWWVRLVGRALGLRAEVWPHCNLDDCRSLLFQVYHQELHWHPPTDNLSGLRFIGDPPMQLADRFDEDAVWLGVYRDIELVACARCILPRPQRSIEMALYHPIPALLLDGGMEVNRLAIGRKYRGGGTFAMVALLVFWIGRCHGGVRHALVASEKPLSRQLYRRIGAEFTGVTFKYHPADLHACELLKLDLAGVGPARILSLVFLRAVLHGATNRRAREG